MQRPLSDKRPVGPFVFNEDKEVLGISGTPFPDRPKNPIILIYKLEGDHIFFSRDFKNAIKEDISQTTDFTNPRVDFKKSGPSSKATFEEQAVIVRVKAGDIPFEHSQVHRIESVIERVAQTSDADTNVSEIIIEQE